MKKGLILSASTGAGHNKAATAIKNALSEKGIQSEIVDSLKFTGSAVDIIISRGYEKTAMYTPKAYGKVYRLYDDCKITNTEKKVSMFFAHMKKRIKKLIATEKPDFIIGTHPFPLMAVSTLKKKGLVDIPLVSVLTDYTIHSTWIESHVDKYIVGDEFVKELLIQEGVHPKKIHPYGIPIEKNFSTREDCSIKEELGLEDKFTILIMGGSFGVGNVKKALCELLDSKLDFQVVVVAGKNQTLREKLEKISSSHQKSKDIKVLGFTNRISELMSFCDVLVTKPGGLTTTEALARQIPLIVPYYIPGQEEENLDFLLNNGLCLKTTDKYSLKILVELLIQNPQRLQRIRENLKLVSKNDSAQNIASMLDEMIQ